MKVSKKLGMYAGVSAAALGFALITVPASAFDEVNWTWDAHIDEQIVKRVNINVNLNPDGMVMLEDLQVSIGDHSASSSVNDIYNNQPGAGFDPGEIEINLDWMAFGDFEGIAGILASAEGGVMLELTDTGVKFTATDGTTATLDCNDSGIGVSGCTSQLNALGITIDLSQFDIGDVIPLDSFNALTELPEVISAATAVANNTAIETDTSVQLHEGQFAFGDGNVNFQDFGDIVAVLATYGVAAELAGQGVNSNLVGAGTLGTAAILGILEKANIDADSQVSNIHNATVDSSATAVVNNLSVDVAAEGDNRLLIGDVVQFSYADTNATSDVRGVYLNNYTNLGELGRPIANSIATAVGNNKSITVMAPVVD